MQGFLKLNQPDRILLTRCVDAAVDNKCLSETNSDLSCIPNTLEANELMNTTGPIVDLQKSDVFFEGLRDSIAFGIPFIFLYISLGILGAAKSLSLQELLATTVFIFSTPLQFILVQNHGDGWILMPIILALNARFALMSTTLSPYLKDVKIIKIMASAVLIVPSVFTACIAHFRTRKEHGFYYFLGMGIPIYGVSLICTCIGFAAGTGFSSPLLQALLDFVLALQFTALTAKQWPHYFNVGSYWAGFVFSPILVYVFHNFNLLFAPFIIGAFAVCAEDVLKERHAK